VEKEVTHNDSLERCRNKKEAGGRVEVGPRREEGSEGGRGESRTLRSLFYVIQ
jgi:hypothetical protein